MLTVRRTKEFLNWVHGLKDGRAKARIAIRIERLGSGNPGKTRALGEGVSELKIDYGPGYRVYFLREGALIVVLLCGGDKSTQARDIRLAKELARKWKE